MIKEIRKATTRYEWFFGDEVECENGVLNKSIKSMGFRDGGGDTLILELDKTANREELLKDINELVKVRCYTRNISNFSSFTCIIPLVLIEYAGFSLKEARDYMINELEIGISLTYLIRSLNEENCKEQFQELLETCTDEEISNSHTRYLSIEINSVIWEEAFKRNILIDEILKWHSVCDVMAEIIEKYHESISGRNASIVYSALVSSVIPNKDKLLDLYRDKIDAKIDAIDIFIKANKNLSDLIDKDLFECEEDYKNVRYVFTASCTKEVKANLLVSCLGMYPKFNKNFEVMVMQLFAKDLFKHVTIFSLPRKKQELVYKNIMRVLEKRKPKKSFIAKIYRYSQFDFNSSLKQYMTDNYSNYPYLKKVMIKIIMSESL